MNNSKTIEEYSNTCSEQNRYLMNNQINNTRIINDIMDKNMDTFLKSIEFAHKFYFDVVQSYYNYIMTIKKSSDVWSYYIIAIKLTNESTAITSFIILFY